MKTVDELRIALSDGEETAVTIHLPEEVSDGLLVAFGFPGGGYARRYYDIHDEGVEGYSQAEWHVARGWAFVSCDHLGVGDSSQPDPVSLTYERLAEANHATVTAVIEKLREGTAVEGVGPLSIRSVVGLGQSAGGCLTIVQQARHRSFDAIGILGYSAIHTVIPSPDGVNRAPQYERNSGGDGTENVAAIGEEAILWAMHHEADHPALVKADVGRGLLVPAGSDASFRSASFPPAILSMQTKGVVAEEAAAISVPVLVASGERDVIQDLHAEPSAYSSSSHITVTKVQGMAHMHNFAETRELLWERIHAWAESVLPR